MSVGIIKESLFMDDFSFNFIYESRLVFGDTEQNYCNVKSGFVLYLLHISRSLTQVLRVFSMIFFVGFFQISLRIHILHISERQQHMYTIRARPRLDDLLLRGDRTRLGEGLRSLYEAAH